MPNSPLHRGSGHRRACSVGSPVEERGVLQADYSTNIYIRPDSECFADAATTGAHRHEFGGYGRQSAASRGYNGHRAVQQIPLERPRASVRV